MTLIKISMTKVFVFLQAVVDFQLYLNNKGIFSYTNPISTKIPSQRQKTHKKYAVRYLKDTINAIKLKDAFCISNRNISGKLLPSSFLNKKYNKCTLRQYSFSIFSLDSLLSSKRYRCGNGASVIKDNEVVLMNYGVGMRTTTNKI